MAKNLHLYLMLVFLFANIVLKANQYNFGRIDYTNGLTNNHIICFSEDNNGFMWIGTASGLNRFDGYNFKIFKHNPADSTSLPDNTIESILKDQLGRLWIKTPVGLCVFNPNTESFQTEYNIYADNKNFMLHYIDRVLTYGDSILIFNVPGSGIIEHNIFTNRNVILQINDYETGKPITNNISSLTIVNRLLYIIHRNGSINIVNLTNGETIKSYTSAQHFLNREDQDYQLYVDKFQNIWVFSTSEALGLLRIDTDGNTTHLTTQSKPALNSNIISVVTQDNENKIWIGTDHGGLNIISPDLKTIDFITREKSNENSLSQDVITDIFMNSKGIIWIGTFKQGANYYHKNLFRFSHFRHQPNIPNSLPYDDVNCFTEDSKNNLWIGTNGQGIIYYDRQKNEFKLLEELNKKLKSKVIVWIFIDKQNKVWIGTYHGGLAYYDGKNLIQYLHEPYNPKSISDNKIWRIFEDSHDNLWIGTLGGGLDLFDRKQGVFQHYSGNAFNSVNTNFIMDITEDKDGNIWIGTDYGIFEYVWETSRFIHFAHDTQNDSSLSNNFVYKIFSDSRSNIWAGTRDGLNLLDKSNSTFVKFNTSNGLPDNTIMTLFESDKGDLWLSTSGGICKLTVEFDSVGRYKSHYAINFNESDGLQGREFNAGSGCKTSSGELVFGGSNGFNMFNPNFEAIKTDKYSTQIIGLEIFGKEVAVNPYDEKKRILKTTLLNNKIIKLSYNENIFSLKFVTIDYLGAKKIRYRYKLEGFNNQWIHTNWQDRKATFTNLNPGKYTFKVQSAGYNSEWQESEASLNIVINPPWFRTWAAYIAYYVLVVALIFIARSILIQSERARYEQDQVIKESKRQQELNALKTRFFTNVSHEFRTPLTLILTPLEKLIKSNLDNEAHKHLALMHQNAKRLLTLVNQLLDFRKSEANKLKVNLIYGNIIGFMNHTIESFSDFRESKNIELEFLPDEKELFMQFDKDKVEKILFNLLSNAFKFTSENGFIKVFTEVRQTNNKEFLIITVRDNGIGIPEELQQKVFERFYQNELPNQFITKGSGIGLSLTKDFVDLLKGQISVKSQQGKGSDFIIELPINRSKTDENCQESTLAETEITTENQAIEDAEPEENKSKKTILIVEDNADFRYYIKDSLITRFNIIEAGNGKIALDILENRQPDLIVSDVMMPEMDGFKLCAEIKTNATFSHIPIILLTAKSTHQDKIEGFNQGADEYITKPFNFDILESRIDYLLAQREKFINHYQKSFEVATDTPSITPLDEKLLKKTLDLINENLSSAEFSVEKLSKELGMSRVYLYKKISSLTGKTPIELIRLVRLKKSTELLIKTQLTISEIAYEVGFTDPRYFSKQFKAEFNMLPSAYKENQGL